MKIAKGPSGGNHCWLQVRPAVEQEERKQAFMVGGVSTGEKRKNCRRRKLVGFKKLGKTL